MFGNNIFIFFLGILFSRCGMVPSDVVTLTSTFRLKRSPEGLDELIEVFKKVVNYLIDYLWENNIGSYKQLIKEKYWDVRKKFPELKTVYIIGASKLAFMMYRSAKRKKGKKPVFTNDAIFLHKNAYRVFFDKHSIGITTVNGRKEVEYYPSKHHERFRDWKMGEGVVKKRGDNVFVHISFSREVDIVEPVGFVGVDLNEDNVTLSFPDGGFKKIVTNEKKIRTSYFVKRKKIQKKIRAGKKRKMLLEKYGERERNKILDLYHKVANRIVEEAEKYGGIAMENLEKIREKIRYGKKINGRLHRWSFRKLQTIIEYKAKLKGIKVVYVDPHHTSTKCPRCGEKLKRTKKHRILKCKNCGLEADRDMIGSWNIRLKAQKDVGSVPFPPKAPQ